MADSVETESKRQIDSIERERFERGHDTIERREECLALDRHDGGRGDRFRVLSAPELRDGLHLRVERDALLAVEVHVAHKRAARARERKHGQRHWNRHLHKHQKRSPSTSCDRGTEQILNNFYFVMYCVLVARPEYNLMQNTVQINTVMYSIMCSSDIRSRPLGRHRCARQTCGRSSRSS